MLGAGLLGPRCQLRQHALGAADLAGDHDVNDALHSAPAAPGGSGASTVEMCDQSRAAKTAATAA